jgi:hypothetical protein
VLGCILGIMRMAEYEEHPERGMRGSAGDVGVLWRGVLGGWNSQRCWRIILVGVDGNSFC